MPDACPPDPDLFRRRFASEVSAIEPLTHELMAWAAARGASAQVCRGASLVLEELATNVVLHGFFGQSGFWIDIEAQVQGGVLTVTLEDEARPFNPLMVPEPDTTLPLEEREIGGLGLLFVRRTADQLHYERRQGEPPTNRVTFCKGPAAA
jgi:serine/threonine-protein kinase RsbW